MKKTRDMSHCPCLGTGPSHGQPPGAGGVQVWIAPPPHTWDSFPFNWERLRTEIEVRLSLAGVSLRHTQENDWEGGPCLGVIVTLQPAKGAGSRPFSLEVFFVDGQPTSLGPFGPSLHLKWCREARGEVRSGLTESDWEPLYEALARLLEEFLEDFLRSGQLTSPLSRAVN